MNHKLIAGVLCIYLMVASIFGGTNQVNAAIKKEVTMSVRDCNITIQPGEKDDFEFEYNTKKFKVTTVGQKSKKIFIEKKKNGENLGLQDKVTVKMPKRFGYDRLFLDGKRAGVSIGKINVPMKIQMNYGSVSLNIWKGNSREISCTMDHSAGSFSFSKDSNYFLNLMKKSCACAMDSRFKGDTSTNKYCYRSGKGTFKLKINATSSALSFKYR